MPDGVKTAVDTVIRTALALAATPPQERTASPLPRWTLKRLVQWVQSEFSTDCCRETLRKTLKGLGFSWKKARKLLNKVNPAHRAAFLEKLKGLLDDALHQRALLVYMGFIWAQEMMLSHTLAAVSNSKPAGLTKSISWLTTARSQ